MLRKGLAVAVILLFIGVAVAPTIYADVDKPELEVEEDVTPTPIALVFQLIAKLRNHKDIENVETEEEVLQIIESDEELNSIYEELSAYGDCGCEDESSPLEWSYPFTCTLMFPFFMVSYIAWLMTPYAIVKIIYWSWLSIGDTLNCWWRG